MRVVELGKFFPAQFGQSRRAGGLEEVVRDNAQDLSEDYEVSVVVSSETRTSSSENWEFFNVTRVSTEFIILSQPINFRLARAINSQKPDIIHFHAPNYWGALILLIFFNHIPIIITHHSDVNGKGIIPLLLRPLYRALVYRAKSVIVLSDNTAINSKDLPKKLKFQTVPHGLEPANYQITKELRQQAKAFREQLEPNAFVIGFVGRLARYKGLHVAIEALASLSDTCLLIVGEGQYRKSLEDLADSLKVRDRIRFLGRVPHAEKLLALQACDVFILPSTDSTEAFGIAQVEAQLFRLPTVVSNLPTGVTDVTVAGSTGLVCEPGNVGELVDALATLRADPELRARLGRDGQHRALRFYTKKASRDALLRVFAPVRDNQ